MEESSQDEDQSDEDEEIKEIDITHKIKKRAKVSSN